MNKLTAMQTELLLLLWQGARFGISDKRIARALERKGFAKYYEKSDAWDITNRGKSAVARLRLDAVSASGQSGRKE